LIFSFFYFFLPVLAKLIKTIWQCCLKNAKWWVAVLVDVPVHAVIVVDEMDMTNEKKKMINFNRRMKW